MLPSWWIKMMTNETLVTILWILFGRCLLSSSIYDYGWLFYFWPLNSFFCHAWGFSYRFLDLWLEAEDVETLEEAEEEDREAARPEDDHPGTNQVPACTNPSSILKRPRNIDNTSSKPIECERMPFYINIKHETTKLHSYYLFKRIVPRD